MLVLYSNYLYCLTALKGFCNMIKLYLRGIEKINTAKCYELSEENT